MNPKLPLPVSAYVQIIANEAMQYKEQIKTVELITKIRIIRYALMEHVPLVQLARSFSCHRNTVRNILQAFKKNVSTEDQLLLLKPGAQCSSEDLVARYQKILNKKRIPKTHKRRAPSLEEKEIVVLFTEKKIRD